MLPYKATLFTKTGKANWLVAWHQDTALPVERLEKQDGWGAKSMKAGVLFAQAPASALSKILAIRIHLDASQSANGPLRVLPESHRLGVLTAEEIDEVARRTKSETCLAGRGGVVAMSPLLLHASSKSVSDEPRRVLHIEYAESRDIEPGIRLAVA
jgi:ectoine hydroxylase-related dioxygenase (phytanoyl-CoA dioxygenase family)